jgi:hypothetical protein
VPQTELSWLDFQRFSFGHEQSLSRYTRIIINVTVSISAFTSFKIVSVDPTKVIVPLMLMAYRLIGSGVRAPVFQGYLVILGNFYLPG